jgi:hypothetical protein
MRMCAFQGISQICRTGGAFFRLKRWAIVGCPYGTNTYPGLVVILGNQILVALEKNVPALNWPAPPGEESGAVRVVKSAVTP